MTKPSVAADLEALVSSLLERVRKAVGGGIEAEVYAERYEDRSVELRGGELHGVEESRSEGLGLRLLKDGRTAFASRGGLDAEDVDAWAKDVARTLDFLDREESRVFAQPGQAVGPAALPASLWDDSLFTKPWEEAAEALRSMEAAAREDEPAAAKILRSGYGEMRGEAALANTLGVLVSERDGSASAGLSVLASRDGDVQVGSASFYARHRGDIDFDRLAADAAFRAAALLGARKLPSGRRDVLLDPWVAGEFLGLVSELLAADNVQKGKSLLAGKLGSRAASRAVTLIDDPLRLAGLASSLFDGEGCPCRTKTMIEDGVLKDYFYDAQTARKDGKESNGSAGRSSYKSLPGPSASNFYLAPGKASRDEIIAGTSKGILVLDVMGMHMADTVSGEFSIGVSGLAIEGGKIGQPVQEAMIAGNLRELLDGIDAVASDLTFYGSLGAPTFRIAGLSVA